MKNSSQITGLPIISISDGIQVGKVKSLVINPDKGSIDFLTIDNEDWQVSIKAIPFKKVIGIGEYAVTVDSENAIIDLNEIPITNQLVNKKIKISNTKVMTRKGELLGEVTEFFVDENTGHILGMELKIAGNNVALLSEFVLTYGKDIIIVKEDSGNHFLETADELDPEFRKQTPEIEEKENHFDNDLVNELLGDTNSSIELVDDSMDMAALKEKQIEILKGKKLLKDILDTKGTILFTEGTELTTEDIIKAQEEGPSVLVELSMNVQA
ncbi:PRC-barrel domain-containing protein [Neobacillus sp. MM2021_6]|uniref:PRC-barrel domain-containing protein n=1 Tax=Bacillaceae TaxID=186817 RepID=UPI00140A4ADD|nr:MULTISPECIES: PRC-barrel domain-containing protein [Bacillaceae]MBO0960707.1 PRC-barrel domain-containing protein [Neobacillus sp. MM2021_6]NHC17371.1 photosystem reaction center subunit H [Bacillus sp. MM2020_4]